jgi:hypothetical protein
VQRIFSDRASKATATVPTCSEVVLACQAQSAAIAEYRAAIADHLLRRSKSEPPGSAAAFINRSWLSFLLPIFYQEILDVGPVDEKRHESLVAEILGRGAAAVASAPPPPSALQHVAGGQGQTNPSGFLGRPTSASVVASNLAPPRGCGSHRSAPRAPAHACTSPMSAPGGTHGSAVNPVLVSMRTARRSLELGLERP